MAGGSGAARFLGRSSTLQRALAASVSLPEDVHTWVLWSKDFRPLLNDGAGVREARARHDQLCCYLTITGLGGSALEPNIAPWHEVVAQLASLVELTGDPRRVSVRYDPIVHWYDGEAVRSNMSLAEPVLRAVSEAGITRPACGERSGHHRGSVLVRHSVR